MVSSQLARQSTPQQVMLMSKQFVSTRLVLGMSWEYFILAMHYPARVIMVCKKVFCP